MSRVCPTSYLFPLPEKEKSRLSPDNYVDIWLYIEDGARELPVPKFNWKVVVDTQKSAGIAFVAVRYDLVCAWSEPGVIVCFVTV